MNGTAGKKLSFPFVKIEQTVCTAAKAAAAGMPRDLAGACEAADTYKKNNQGRMSMLQVTKPRKPTKNDPTTRYTPFNAPEKFVELYVYNVDDTIAESELDAVIPDLTPYEQQVYWLDQRINERGVAVDLEAIANVKVLIAEYKDFLEKACEKATRPADNPFDISLGNEALAGLRPTQREKIADWVRANGYPDLLDMQAETIKLLVERDDVPGNVKHVLRIYSTYNAKAVTKFDTILEAVCLDGRLHGMLLYHGAGTGRWSSTIVQLQNLFRPVIDDPEIAVEAFRSRNLKWIQALYEQDFMKVAASTVRSHFIAGRGKKLIALDYAGVESRKNAWLWNETWKLDAFRAFDEGRGPDQYIIAVCDAFGMDPKEMSKKHPRRQWGKAIDLFGGYEGGVGAFVTMAATYGVNLEEIAEAVWPTATEEEITSALWMWNKFGRGTELNERVYVACDIVKQRWRRRHPNTVAGWKELKTAAELAVQFDGNVYPVANGRAAFRVKWNEQRTHKWLCLVLPSRRRELRYYNPTWTPPKTVTVNEKHPFTGEWREVEKEIPGELRFWDVDTKTRRWMETSSYGGKWCENLVQASCADLLRNGMFAMEGGGYLSILTVHDEDVAEVDEAFGSVKEAEKLMCRPEKWFEGLPLVAEGWEGKRYRK
jgi:DNA polymerase